MAKQTTAVASWDEKLAALQARATKAASQFSGGGQFGTIKLDGFTLTADKKEIPGNQFRGVVLQNVLLNTWYEGTWTPGSKETPACYAFGVEGQPMTPHPQSPKPQAASCAVCPKNEFGSHANGKMKACANKVRLLVMPEGGVDDPAEAEKYILDIPPTSGKFWKDGVDSLITVGAAPEVGLLTIGTTNKTGSGAKIALTFTKPAALPREQAVKCLTESEKIGPGPLCTPWAQPVEAAAPPPTDAKGRTKKDKGSKY